MKKLYCMFFAGVFTCAGSTLLAQTVRVVTATNLVFTPAATTATVGDTIRFTFGTYTPGGSPPVGGGFRHTTTSLTVPAGAAAWDDTLFNDIPQHYYFDYVVSVPGEYNYKCTPHYNNGNGMKGTISVSAILPVKLADFTATSVNGKAVLNWQTASEQNSDHFAVQLSYDGLNFTDVGAVPAAGSSNAALKYSYSVDNLQANTAYVYFRLVTIDRDGKEQFSNIFMLHLGKAGEQNLVRRFYPNPAQNGDHVYFTFDSDSDSKIQIAIFETGGRKVYGIEATANKGVNQSHLPLPKLRKGAYYIQFVLGARKQTLPLFLQ